MAPTVAARRTGEVPQYVPIEAIAAALSKLAPEYLSEVMQFVEFLEYKSSTRAGDIADDAALWTAVEANQAYKREHPGEELDMFESGEDFLKTFADL